MNHSTHSAIIHPRICFLFGFLAFCAGIIGEIRTNLLLTSSALFVFLFWIYGKYLRIYLLCGICFLWGIIVTRDTVHKKLHTLWMLESFSQGFSGTHQVEGIIDAFLYHTDTYSVFRLVIDKFDNITTASSEKHIPLTPIIGIQISIPRNLHLSVWDRIQTNGKIYPLSTTPNCLAPYTLCGFSRYAWMQNTFGNMRPRNFQILSSPHTPSIRDAIQKWTKQTLFQWFPRDIAGLLMGMSIGNTDLFNQETKNIFKASGLMHILVVSGSNIAFVILFLSWLLRYIPLPWKMRQGIIIGFVCLYGSLVWWDTPVIRATIMGSLIYIAMQHGSRIHTFPLLVAIAWGYLILRPDALIFDASFWLSFAATLAIIVVYPKIQSLAGYWKILSFLTPLIGVTFAASLGSLAVSIYHFGEIAPFGIFSNILVGGILWILLILTTLYLLLAIIWVSSILYAFGYLIYPLWAYIVTIAEFFGTLPLISIPTFLHAPIVLFSSISLYILGIQKEIYTLSAQKESIYSRDPAIKKDGVL